MRAACLLAALPATLATTSAYDLCTAEALAFGAADVDVSTEYNFPSPVDQCQDYPADFVTGLMSQGCNTALCDGSQYDGTTTSPLAVAAALALSHLCPLKV